MSPSAPTLVFITADPAQPRGSDRTACAVAEVLCRAFGFELELYSSGEVALHAARERAPIAFVASRSLPGIDGIETLRRAKKLHPNTPTILLSSATPAMSRTAPGRIGLGHIVVTRGFWLPQLADILRTTQPAPKHPDLLAALTAPGVAGGAAGPAALGTLLNLVAVSDHDDATRIAIVRFLGRGLKRTRAADALDRVLEAAINGVMVPDAALEETIRVLLEGYNARFERLKNLAEAALAPLPARVAATLALPRFREPNSYDVVRGLLSDASPWVRHAAGQAALQIGVRMRGETSTILEALAHDTKQSSDIRQTAASELIGEGGADPTTRARLESELQVTFPATPTAAQINEWCAEATSETVPSMERVRSLTRLVRDAPKATSHPVVVECARATDPVVRQAAVLGALTLDQTGHTTLLRLASNAASRPDVRGQALVLLAGRRPSPRVLDLCRQAFREGPDELRHSSLFAALQLGDRGFGFLAAVAKTEAVPMTLRVIALRSLVTMSGPGDGTEVLRVAQALAGSADDALASAAFEILTEASGNQIQNVIEQAVLRSADVQHAIAGQAESLGEAGYGALAALSLHPKTSDDVRQRALRVLSETFPPNDVRPIVERARHMLRKPTMAPERDVTGRPILRAEERPIGPSHRLRSAGRSPARIPPRPAARPPVMHGPRHNPPPIPSSDDPTMAITEPQAPATTTPPRPRVVTAPPTTPRHAKLTKDVRTGVRTGPGPGVRSGAMGERPSARPRGQHRASKGSGGIGPAHRRRPKHRQAIRVAPSNVAAARQQLQLALQEGRAGHGKLVELIFSPTIPADLRVTALRALTPKIPVEDARKILDRALLEGPPRLQHAALAAAMSIRGCGLESLVTITRTPECAPDVRLRALRQMVRCHGRDDTRAHVEALLEDHDPEIRRAALEAVFPSMRHTQDSAIEESLINLLEEHPSHTVKIGAARALATFGTARAVEILLPLQRGLLTKPDLRTAARHSAERIGRRDKTAREMLYAAGAKPKRKK